MSVETDSFYLGGYWGPRAEPVESCAHRLARFLRLLREVHPLLGSWHETAGSRREALLHRVDPSPERLRDLLLAGRNRRDDESRTTIAELGFSVDLWNGQNSEASLAVHCGSWAVLPGPTSNNVVVHVPEPNAEAADLYRRDVALGLMRAIVTTWQPSWCTWTSHRLRRAQAPQRGEGVVGWSTYLAHTDGLASADLPRGVAVERLDGGLLLTLEGDAASASPETVSAVRSALGSAVRWKSVES